MADSLDDTMGEFDDYQSELDQKNRWWFGLSETQQERKRAEAKDRLPSIDPRDGDDRGIYNCPACCEPFFVSRPDDEGGDLGPGECFNCRLVRSAAVSDHLMLDRRLDEDSD